MKAKLLLMVLLFALAAWWWLPTKNRGSVTLTQEQAAELAGTLMSEHLLRLTLEEALAAQIERNRVLSTVCIL